MATQLLVPQQMSDADYYELEKQILQNHSKGSVAYSAYYSLFFQGHDGFILKDGDTYKALASYDILRNHEFPIEISIAYTKDKCLYVHYFASLEEGRGWGKQLVNSMAIFAKSKGVDIVLEATAQSRNFYEHLGFEVIATQRQTQPFMVYGAKVFSPSPNTAKVFSLMGFD